MVKPDRRKNRKPRAAQNRQEDGSINERVPTGRAGKAASTSTLLNRLFCTSSFARYKDRNAESMNLPSFHEYICGLCAERGEVREHVIKRAELDRVYGHQIFTRRYLPSRDKVIQLAFGFGLNGAETQTLLKLARKPELYPRVERDAAILYCLHKGKTLMETQSMLSELGAVGVPDRVTVTEAPFCATSFLTFAVSPAGRFLNHEDTSVPADRALKVSAEIVTSVFVMGMF